MTQGPLCIVPLRSTVKVASRYVLLDQAISAARSLSLR